MIRGHFTFTQRAALKEIAKRRARYGELQKLAQEWGGCR
jgi:hypothetical protein